MLMRPILLLGTFRLKRAPKTDAKNGKRIIELPQNVAIYLGMLFTEKSG